MSREKIFVVEDEKDLQELIRYNLEKEGYSVTCYTTGEECLEKFRVNPPDLVLLDVMLPGLDGFEICKHIRTASEQRYIPIILLTARSEESDIVAGLELGADDYITKPFSPRVLVARIRNVLRRDKGPRPDSEKIARVHGISIDPARFEVMVEDEKITLTKTEFRILYLLACNPGRVFSRAQIVDRVHGDDYPVTERSIDVQVVGLRKKLGDSGSVIETVRGIGYRLKD